GPEGDDPPEVQEGVAVDDCLALEEIVGREQDRAAAGHPVPEDRAKPDPHAHVDVRERLVEEQHAGVAEHHPREFRALPLAHRKLADPALPVVRDTEERQGPFHLHRDVVGRDAGHLREEREVPSDGHLLERERNVDEDPQLPPHLVGAARTSMPQTVAEPASGWVSPERTRKQVVLPAPFGPNKPNTSPSLISSETWSRARTRGYCLTSPEACTSIRFGQRTKPE